MALTQITSDVISTGVISATMIANGSITSAHVANNTITSAHIVSVSNTAITGNIISSQIASVSNTAITGNIISSQITSVSNTQLTGVVTSNQLASTAQYMGFKNRIINGDFRIDQRNAGASLANNSAASLFSLDRWPFYGPVSSKFTMQQNAGSVTPPAGFTNYLGITSSAATSVGAGDTYLFSQPIEGLNIADLGWGTANAKTVTLSFWVRSSLTGTFGGSVKNAANNRSYPFTYTINSANTWEYETITIPGDTTGTWVTTNAKSLSVVYSLGVGSTYTGTAGVWAATDYNNATGAISLVGTSGATLYLTGVQLEVGSQATSFDYRDYGRELIMCQRYYETNYNIGFLPTSAIGLEYSCGTYISAIDVSGMYGSIYFKAYKRATPTMTIYSYNGTAGKTSRNQSVGTVGTGTVAAFRYGQAGFGAIGDSGNGLTAGHLYWIGWTADAEI